MSTYHCIGCPRCQRSCTAFRESAQGFGAGPAFDDLWAFLAEHVQHAELVMFSEHDPRYESWEPAP